MSTAADKNRQALVALLGSAALADKLTSIRIAVVTPERDAPASAALLVEVLADTLGRLWPNIEFDGELANLALRVAHAAAESGSAPTQGMRIGWSPPYDVVVSVGGRMHKHGSPEIVVGADGWRVQFGNEAPCGDSLNPVGPAFAAALTAAQVFASCFSKELEGSGAKPLEDWGADVRELFGAPELAVDPLDLLETHVFGGGAVTHGLVWLLERWPEAVLGNLALVDSDNYGSGNGQRYAFMQPGSSGQSKVQAIAARLRKHANLTVTPHDTDMNAYCRDRGYARPLQRVVTGLDSEESRRQAALKLPLRTINMWTSDSYIGAGQYVPGDQRGCLACAYPEPTDTPQDEAATYAAETGLLPGLVRELLDSSRALTVEEAQQVASKRRVPVGDLIGEPIRSARPVLCATGHFEGEGDLGKAVVDVPFAFSSLLAGIAGFMMLLRDVQLGRQVSEGWNQHVFKKPSRAMMSVQGIHETCVRCAAVKLMQARHSLVAA